MDFDSVFDYSFAISNISNALNAANVQLVACNTLLAMYQSAVGYDVIVAPQILSFTSQRVSIQNQIDTLQAILTEINNVVGLSADTKAALFEYYTILGCNTVDYMRRIPFNYEAALVDPDIANLLADTVNSHAAKNAIANIVYDRYQVASQYYAVLSQITLPPS